LKINHFQLEHSVEVDDETKRVHGYASYWGVHVDEEYQPYITETTEWVKDAWRKILVILKKI
jgi:hypothetical protein